MINVQFVEYIDEQFAIHTKMRLKQLSHICMHMDEQWKLVIHQIIHLSNY